jgi:N-acetylneuraminic acid mutarotase
MRRGLRRAYKYLAAVAGVLVLAGMVLTSPAQASLALASAVPAQAASSAKAAPAVSAAGVPAVPGTRAACAAASTGHMTCMSLLRTNVPHYKGVLRPAAAAADIPGYGPADLQSAYDLPSATAGAGETVAIVDAYDDPNAEADLQVYRAQYGLPVCDTANGCFTKVNQDGFTSPLPTSAGSAGAQSVGWDVEESLDIEMVSAACPNCRILLVEANSQDNSDLDAAEDTAVALGAKFVSNSWAGPEYPGELADDAYFNHPGVVITAAAGDDGYGVFYPAASPYVTAVGGTTLTQASGTARGWTESAWGGIDQGGTGSGCSFYEPKPAWQTDTGCAHRTVADVSAVADPDTGVAVYDSFSAGGWNEVGGTSVATPLIAAAYALAGPPAPGSSPASYPYAHPSELNNITQGTNGGPCSPAYLCNAGPGYNGPTGLGTPDGVAAFSSGTPYGTISGKVSGPSGPLPGATVTAGGYTTTTGPGGSYVLAVPDGSYPVSATAPGYPAATASVRVTQGKTATADLTVTRPARSSAVSGTVTDGSGHRWPLYAAIRVSGYPGAFYTSPATGRYSISLPRGSYTLTAIPLYPGYRTATVPVTVGASAVTANVPVPADTSTDTADSAACTAPGYADTETGSTETFTGWGGRVTGGTPQDGWTVVNNLPGGNTWTFENPDPSTYPPPPGGDNDFATVFTGYDGEDTTGADQDTSLVSPVTDLSGAATPVITFDSLFGGGYAESGSVDLSLDGGQTWTTVWQRTGIGVTEIATISIPQAAGNPDVRVRFHFANPQGASGAAEYDWEIDNVFIGNKACAPAPGGLVTGRVTDHNTGKPLNHAWVTDDFSPAQPATSGAPWGAPGANGFYWLFSSPGATMLTASDADNYTSSTQMLNVAADAVTAKNWSLQAGDLAPLPGSLSVTQALGGKGTGTLKFLNTGTQPVHVQLSGQSSGFTPIGATASDVAGAREAPQAPLEKIKGHYSPAAALAPRNATAKDGSGIRLSQATPSGASWSAIPDYPTQVYASDVAYDPGNGDVYSAGGTDGTWYLTSGYVFNPLRQQWSAIAPLPQALDSSAAAFIDGKFYVAGGAAGSTGNTSSDVYAYQPSSDSWSQVASLPAPVAGAETAVLNGALYVIGGCPTTTYCAPPSSAVYRYDPSDNKWTTLASLPQAVAFGACAGIDAEIVCAGGLDENTGSSLSTTYIYHPDSNTWSQGADMPYDDWGMAYAGSGGMLQIAAGVTDQSTVLTNQAEEYDSASNTWQALPNDNQAEYLGGSACGLYQVGGESLYQVGGRDGGSGGYVNSPTSFASTLPGYDQCGTGAIPWLSTSSSTFTLQPGQVQTVTVTANSAVVSQPGTYTATLTVRTDTPYSIQPVSISMRVNPPRK